MLEDWARSLKNPHKARNKYTLYRLAETERSNPMLEQGLIFPVFSLLVFSDFKLVCSCPDP